jgi:hypothetical protein
MPKTHPHAEATYRVIRIDDQSFGVEVTIPDSYPTKVNKFDTEADAEAWIGEHRRWVESQTATGGWFRRSGRPPPRPTRS